MKTGLCFSDIIDDLLQEKKKSGLSEGKIAKEIGIEPSTLAQYKSGDRSPTLANLIKVSDYFRVSLDYLTGRSDYASDKIRYLSVESLGLSWKSFLKLQKIMENNMTNVQMNNLLSSDLLPAMLHLAHSYEKACYALYFVIAADRKKVPISEITVSDEEIQSMLKVFELSRDSNSEQGRLIGKVFGGRSGVINPAAGLKSQIEEYLRMMLNGIAIHAEEQVERITGVEL